MKWNEVRKNGGKQSSDAEVKEPQGIRTKSISRNNSSLAGTGRYGRREMTETVSQEAVSVCFMSVGDNAAEILVELLADILQTLKLPQ